MVPGVSPGRAYSPVTKLQILSVAICFMSTSSYVHGGGLRANIQRKMDNLKQDDALNEKVCKKPQAPVVPPKERVKITYLKEQLFK